MNMLTLKVTDHAYYCDGNWEEIYESWPVAFDDLKGWDVDYNHLYRFDLESEEDSDDSDSVGVCFKLKLCFVQQRKARLGVVLVKNITEEDIPAINEYLTDRWNYIKRMWAEIS